MINDSYLIYTTNSYILIRKKSTEFFKKWTKYLIKHLINEDIQMASKHVKSCSTSYVIRDNELKQWWDITTHLSLWPKSRIQTTSNAFEDVEQQKLSIIVCGNAKWYSHFEGQFEDFLQN